MTQTEHNQDIASRRITNIILTHWNEARGSKRFPAETDLDPAILEPLLDSCFLIKAEGISEGKYSYKFLGATLLSAYGSELTYTHSGSKENPLTQKEKLQEVLEKGYPVSDEGEFTNINGDIIKYRQCLVPLSSDGKNIDSIFGGMRLKIFPKDE